MSHAFSMVPNFSSPPAGPPLCIERLPFHADPVLAAIDAHQEAWAVLQAASDDHAILSAEDAGMAAFAALLATPCATREGAFALLRHLRWFLEHEAGSADAYGEPWRIAQAREADLTLLLGVDGIRRIPVALPLGRLVSVPVLPEPLAPTPMRTPLVIDVGPARALALVRLGRAGELLTALVLVGGGTVLTGLATLV